MFLYPGPRTLDPEPRTPNPVFTVNGLTITILADLYFLFGSFIEERRFIRTFGDQYREYRERVPRLVPFC